MKSFWGKEGEIAGGGGGGGEGGDQLSKMINLFRVVFVLFGDHFSRLVLLHGICLCKSF